MLYVTVCGLFGNRTCGSRLEHVLASEKCLGVFMSGGLILAREVEVDIGLLIAVEAEEGLKRDIVAVAVHRLAAIRADGIRHVASGASDVLFDAR